MTRGVRESDEQVQHALVDAMIPPAQSGDTRALAYVDQYGDWHQRRRTGIGGSDVAALLELNTAAQSARPIDVYRDKLGEVAPWAGNERTRRGKRLEPFLAGEYQIENGGGVYLSGELPTLRHPDRPWHVGTPDRLVVRSPWLDGTTTMPARDEIVRVLELKTHGGRAYGMGDDGDRYGVEGTDELPRRVLLQVLWYVSLLDVDGGGDVATLSDTHLYRGFHVARDRAIESDVVAEVDAWWRRHVIARVPPSPDGSASFARYLRERCKGVSSGVYREPSLDESSLVERLRTLRALSRAASDACDLAAQRVQIAIGDDDGLALAEGKLHFRPERGRVSDAAVIGELAQRAGVSPAQLDAIRERHRGRHGRPLRTPRAWSSDERIGVGRLDEIAALLAAAAAIQ